MSTDAIEMIPAWRQRLRDYYELCKPRGMVPLDVLIIGTLGIGLMAGSAAAINQLLDAEVDARMARTCGRPLVTGNLKRGQSIRFAAVLGIAGMAVLYVWINPLTAWLTFFTLVGYAGVYTLYLKRATPQNIVIGGAAGAAPPILGWVAVTGTLDPEPLLLFLIIFIWTPPHFWALAIERHEEYAKVDIPMLPVTHGLEYTRTQILLYTFLLIAVSLLPFAYGMSGALYGIGALLLGLMFLAYAWRLKFAPQPGLAMRTFGFSLVYLMGIFTLLLVDHYIPAMLRLIA